ncbi:MAG: hypothetical protein ACYTKD_06065, partial [Planctomycetota bacterium]
MLTRDRDCDATPQQGAWFLVVAACALASLPAIASAGETAGEDARRALLVGLAKAGTKSLAEARAFLESEGGKAPGLGKEVRALGRRLKEAVFVEELAEVGLESTRGVMLHPHSGWPQEAPQRGAFTQGKPRWGSLSVAHIQF